MASASLNGSILPSGAPEITAFAHDGMNRMVAASKPGMTAVYAYDADDRRVSKTVSQGAAVTTRTLWSGTDELGEYDGANTLLRRVIPGPGIDDKVATVSASGAISYFHTDRLGSVVAISNASGATTETYAYSPFGESDAPVTGNPWRYTGRYLDAETGLYYYRARYYAPRLGQFLETDPIGTKDDPNLYMYVANDPVNLTDPSGEKIECFKRPDGSEYCVVTADKWAEGLIDQAVVTGWWIGRTLSNIMNNNSADGADDSSKQEGVFRPTEDDIEDEIFDPDAQVGQLPQNEAEAQGVREAVRENRGRIEIPEDEIGDPNHRGEEKWRFENDSIRVHYWRNTKTGATYGGKIVRRFGK